MSVRKINVIDANEVHSGVTNGKPWAIYEIVATTPEGEPIDLKLKSFERLDGLVDVDVERQDHEKYGTSYMLKKVGGGGGGGGDGSSAGARLGPKVDELRDRVTALEEQVEFLRNQISSLNARPAAPPTAPAGVAPDAGAARFGGDDDIPF